MIAASPSVMISGPTSFRITPASRSLAIAASTMATSPPREVPRIVTFGKLQMIEQRQHIRRLLRDLVGCGIGVIRRPAPAEIHADDLCAVGISLHHRVEILHVARQPGRHRSGVPCPVTS
jgi:hypothetical protein